MDTKHAAKLNHPIEKITQVHDFKRSGTPSPPMDFILLKMPTLKKIVALLPLKKYQDGKNRRRPF